MSKRVYYECDAPHPYHYSSNNPHTADITEEVRDNPGAIPTLPDGWLQVGVSTNNEVQFFHFADEVCAASYFREEWSKKEEIRQAVDKEAARLRRVADGEEDENGNEIPQLLADDPETAEAFGLHGDPR